MNMKLILLGIENISDNLGLRLWLLDMSRMLTRASINVMFVQYDSSYIKSPTKEFFGDKIKSW